MNIPTIQMPKDEAAKAFQSYRRLVRARMREEDRALLEGYRTLSEGKPVVDVVDVFRATGLDDAGRPRVAIMRADKEWCFFDARGGEVIFMPYRDSLWDGRRSTNPITRIPLDAFGEGAGQRIKTNTHAWAAMTPIVPAQWRPARKLENYHLLWEAEWKRTAPKDPMLLKRITGNLFAVLAVWDLTDLERAVLNGVRTTPPR